MLLTLKSLQCSICVAQKQTMSLGRYMGRVRQERLTERSPLNGEPKSDAGAEVVAKGAMGAVIAVESVAG